MLFIVDESEQVSGLLLSFVMFRNSQAAQAFINYSGKLQFRVFPTAAEKRSGLSFLFTFARRV
jgi:hypothetical protein